MKGCENIKHKEQRIITYQKLLETLRKDNSLNDWEKNFMTSIVNAKRLSFSDKQKEKLLTMTDKSKLNSYYKILLKQYIHNIK